MEAEASAPFPDPSPEGPRLLDVTDADWQEALIRVARQFCAVMGLDPSVAKEMASRALMIRLPVTPQYDPDPPHALVGHLLEAPEQTLIEAARLVMLTFLGSQVVRADGRPITVLWPVTEEDEPD